MKIKLSIAAALAIASISAHAVEQIRYEQPDLSYLAHGQKG